MVIITDRRSVIHMNNVLLTGRLTKNAELLHVKKGDRTAVKFTLAVKRNYKNANSEVESDFIPVIYFANHAAKLINHLEKGRMISVSGKIRVHSSDGPDNHKRYYTDIIANNIDFLDNSKNKAL
jgi:single-strand DNA-binding protein